MSAFSQIDNVQEIISSKDGHSKAILFSNKGNNPLLSQKASVINSLYNLTKNDELKIKSANEDKLGIKHTRLYQYYDGIKVDKSEIVVHSKNDSIFLINGEAISIESLDITPKITKDEAIGFALKEINAKKYAWESSDIEENMRRETYDKSFTFYPNPELIIWNSTDNKNYRLAYKVNIFAMEPYKKVVVYIDAKNSSVLDISDRLVYSNVIGSAVTKYSGNQSIATESTSSGYKLRDYSRGQGIEVKDCNKTIATATASDFIDANNVWDEWNNSDMDNAALDASLAAQKTYDYFHSVFNRNSYDNAGSKIKIYIHFWVSYNQSSWDPDWNFITCGDGDGTSFSPLTDLDAISHEFSHGVAYSYTNLGNTYETGAIAEGLSDIWSAVINQYANLPGYQMWTEGEKYKLIPSHRRNFACPKASHYHYLNIDTLPGLVYPDTYQGTGWYSGTWDNGGVHINSTVLSYWFYLLSNGFNSTNDYGNHYIVLGIGTSKAANILYNSYNYLTPGIDFPMLSFFTTYEATQLYGNTSNEAIQTNNAWYAVGLGTEVSNLVTGNDYICSSANATYSLPSEFAGSYIQWDKSNNIQIISGQGTTTLTVTQNENYPGGVGTVSVVYNHGSGNKTSIIHPWVGSPETPSTFAVCDPLDPPHIDLNEQINIMLDNHAGAPDYGNWTSAGCCYIESMGKYMYAYGTEDGGEILFYVTTSNDCGISPEYFGGILVGDQGEELKSADNSLIFFINPNPSNDYVDINITETFDFSLLNNYKVDIIDVNSKVVKSVKLSGPCNRINIQDLIPGTYIVKLTINKMMLHKTLIIN
jgi:Zn-dependent metalloprotease